MGRWKFILAGVVLLFSLVGCTDSSNKEFENTVIQAMKEDQKPVSAQEVLSIFDEQVNLISAHNMVVDLEYTLTDKTDLDKMMNLIKELKLSKAQFTQRDKEVGTPPIERGISFQLRDQNEYTYFFEFINENGTVFLEYTSQEKGTYNTNNTGEGTLEYTDLNTEYYMVDKYIGNELLDILKKGKPTDLNNQ